jgi:hypothetical protein
MPPSASLHTAKHRRRALLAILVAPLVALGIAIGPGTAHAGTPELFFPAQPHALENGTCFVSGWPNGIILCQTGIGVNFYNNTQEIFGIGPDRVVYTDYGTESNPSGWKSMGGTCNSDLSNGLSSQGNYALTYYTDINLLPGGILFTNGYTT